MVLIRRDIFKGFIMGDSFPGLSLHYKCKQYFPGPIKDMGLGHFPGHYCLMGYSTFQALCRGEDTFQNFQMLGILYFPAYEACMSLIPGGSQDPFLFLLLPSLGKL